LKRIRRETDHLRRYAVEHFSERSAMTWERAAEMLQKQAQPELALTCAESAIKRIQD
jgi:predicted HTH domain antitoxin